MASTGSIIEDFEWGTIDTIKWSTALSANAARVNEENQYLYISHPDFSEYNSLHAATTYDLTGSSFYVTITDAGNQSITSHEAIVGVYLDANNVVWFVISGGNISAYKKVAGIQTQIGASVAYDSTNHKRIRFSESAGTITIDTSPLGAFNFTNRWSVANPFAITAIKPYMQSGCWQFEAAGGSYAAFDNFNLDAGAKQFIWKGYTWNKRFHLGPSMYNNQFSSSNVSNTSSNGPVTISVSNPGASPSGGEFYSDKKDWGYGTYTVVVGTQCNNLNSNIVMGGMFLFDYTQPPDYAEIDMGEVRYYNSNPNCRILYSHTWNNGNTNQFTTDDLDMTSDPVFTNVGVWEPGKITYYTYSGVGTSGPLINKYVQLTRNFRPKNQRMYFNIWVQNLSSPASAPATSVTLLDFKYTPMWRSSNQISRTAAGTRSTTNSRLTATGRRAA